jgi:2,4-dienoyl-CoA reductase-like NADH-dependent reductase (Old Yellow Enzyme family)
MRLITILELPDVLFVGADPDQVLTQVNAAINHMRDQHGLLVGVKLSRPEPPGHERFPTLGALLYVARDMDPDRPLLLCEVSSGHDQWHAQLEGFGKSQAVERHGAVFPACPVINVGIYATQDDGHEALENGG